jgi:hypothetical protein
MLTHLSIKRATALALALGAVSAGPAAARPIEPSGQVHVVMSAPSAPQAVVSAGGIDRLTSRLAHGYGEHLSVATASARYRLTPHPPIVISGAAAGRGFNWGDAGIGAVGGLALSLLGLGGAAAATRRRPNNAAGGQFSPAATL